MQERDATTDFARERVEIVRRRPANATGASFVLAGGEVGYGVT